MPLILAIVADPHQAAQLAALVRGRLAVDLVQAAEVGEGLLALDNRIPDLILTSPLMSPFDDGVLDEYLRDLGPTGAHVQTLRIPVMNQAPKKTQRLGFSLLRRAKTVSTPEGCDPKLFADEIAQYLVRAAEEKHNAAPEHTARGTAQADASAPTFGEAWAAASTETPVDAEPAWDPPPWEAAAFSQVIQDDTVSPPALVYEEAEPPAAQAFVPAASPMEREREYSPIEEQPVDSPIEANPVYSQIEANPVYSPVEDNSVDSSTEDGPVYSPIEDDALPILRDAIPQDTPPITASEIHPSAAADDAEEPVVRAPLSLFEGVETTIDPALYLPTDPIPAETMDAVEVLDSETMDALREEVIAVEAEEVPTPIALDAPVEEQETGLAAGVNMPVEEAPVPDPVPILELSAVVDPVVEPVPDPPVAVVVAAPVPDPPAPAEARVSEQPAAPKLTASFRAALAAIKAAWDAPAVTAPASPAPPVPEPPMEVSSPSQAPASLEVDLTGVVVELIDDPRQEEPQEQPAPVGEIHTADLDTETDAHGEAASEPVEVYELSVETDLDEIESRLLMPPEPSRTEAAPSSEPAVPETADEEAVGGRVRKETPRGQRVKSGKRQGKATQNKPRREEPEPVQDEWGIFDPNQCGFAALVDKLEEVADEKPENKPRKGTKVRVISYS